MHADLKTETFFTSAPFFYELKLMSSRDVKEPMTWDNCTTKVHGSEKNYRVCLITRTIVAMTLSARMDFEN